jgi:hypothetical protein
MQSEEFGELTDGHHVAVQRGLYFLIGSHGSAVSFSG